MIPKEFQKWNLALELKAGKNRLEGLLHGFSDEQSERAGVTRSGSVVDVLSEIVATEFLALMAISSRLPGLPVNRLANADEGTRAARGTERAAASKSFETLLAEFDMLRSAVIRLVEGRKSHGANPDAKYEYVAEACVAKFNARIEEIERWRSSEIVGFSAKRPHTESRESELNQAIVELSWEDFLAGNFDLKALFSLSFERFYSDDFVLWLGTEELDGKSAAFERLAETLEPIYTLLEMGMAFVESFRVTATFEDDEGNFVTDWEAVLGGTYSTGIALRWRTVRAWKNRMVIAERIEELRSPNP